MNNQATMEAIIRRRMHGLYLSRRCDDLESLAHELLGLHSWFGRNVPFSALIRGADLRGWKTRLTKTWLYRGTLHGVAYEDLPQLLALSAGEQKDGYFAWLSKAHGAEVIRDIADEVLRLMEDGVFSRTEFRSIFAERYEPKVIEDVFSSWGGIFVYLARLGKVAFKNMTSRDFELIGAEPTLRFEEVLPELLSRYFRAYGPATLADAVYFFGISKEDAKRVEAVPLDDLSRLEYGICLPTIAVDGQVAGLWNIRKNEPVVEFFTQQPKRIQSAALELVESMRWRTSGVM